MTAEVGYLYVLDDLGATSTLLSYLEIINECPEGFHVVELVGGTTYREAWYKRAQLEDRINTYGVFKDALP
jgi:hypothetical protein